MIAPGDNLIELDEWRAPSQEWWDGLVATARSRVVRPIGQWAEEEIIVPTGPFAGFRYQMDRQPFTRVWFEQLGNPYWREYCATGPSQCGKSLSFFVIPILYFLFEVQETVICVTVTEEMFADKWKRDLRPVIEKTQYADLIPKSGSGSRGGVPNEITFLNGVTLKNMTTSGQDKSRAYYTARVLVYTEVDGMQKAQSTSDEAGPIKQVEARARSEERANRIIIKECTTTTKDGYIWDSITRRGSNSQLRLPCPHCGEYVCLDRVDLKGWQECKTELEVEEKTAFVCSSCEKSWTEEERKAANAGVRLVHPGQTIDASGSVEGPIPETRTFGMRVSAVNNMFLPQQDIGYDEWAGSREGDEIQAEKQLCQFVWALPFDPEVERYDLDPKELINRKLSNGRGTIPLETDWVTIGVDVGLYRCHWAAIAWLRQCVGLVIDYGKIELKLPGSDGTLLDSKDIGFDKTFPVCMQQWRDRIFEGWVKPDQALIQPSLVLVDFRYQGPGADADIVSRTLRNWKMREVKGVLGFGVNHYKFKRYRQPNHKKVLKIGHYYHLEYSDRHQQRVYEANMDAWKTILHGRLAKGKDEAGAMVMYDAVNPNEHQEFMQHITAEERRVMFVPGLGNQERYVQTRKANHYLDACAYAVLAGHAVGFRVNKEDRTQPKVRQAGLRQRMKMPDGRPFFVAMR